MRRPRTELSGTWAARALAAGREVWLFVDTTHEGHEELHGGTEAAVRSALLEHAGLDTWPPEWTLRRVEVAR